jgi:hypothetical protein
MDNKMLSDDLEEAFELEIRLLNDVEKLEESLKCFGEL